jgi:hypothetical protein
VVKAEDCGSSTRGFESHRPPFIIKKLFRAFWIQGFRDHFPRVRYSGDYFELPSTVVRGMIDSIGL